MQHLNEALDELVKGGIITHAAVRVGRGDEVLYDAFRGGANDATLFDMASVTKVIVTTTLALIALDRGLLSLDDGVDKFYPTEKPLTVKNLLTHTVGIGYKLLAKEGVTCANVAEKILAIPSDIPIGTDVLYSCPGYILLGKILEEVLGKPLNESFDELVCAPLGLCDSTFLPKARENAVNSDLDDGLLFTVNDYNCRHLGGVAGNAGLFSTLADVTKYVKLLQQRGAPLFSERSFDLAVQNHTVGMSASRGLGFLYVDRRYTQACGLFADGAIGHCGHTGQSLFLDYRSGLYVIILSDATISTVRKYGTEHYNEVMDMRARLHNAIAEDLAY